MTLAGGLMKTARWARHRIDAAGARTWALAIGAVALVVRLPFLFGFHAPPPGTDSDFFLGAANSIAAFHGFPGRFWTPGYPIFIAVLHPLPGRADDAVVVVQHLMGVAIVALILLASWRWFGRAPALMASSLAAITPVLVVHEHTYLPDFLFGTVVFAGALLLAEAVVRDAQSMRLLVAAGAVFGVATWVKPAGQFLFAAAPLALVLATRDLRRIARATAVVTLAMLLVMAPWLVRNTIHYGFPSMSDQSGATLFHRAFEVSRLPIPRDVKFGRFAVDVQRPLLGPKHPGFSGVFARRLTRDRGVDSDDAWAIERRLALTAIERHPGAYLDDAPRLVAAWLHHVDQTPGSESLVAELDRTDPPFPRWITTGLFDVGRRALDVWWVLSLGGLAGLLVLVVGNRGGRAAGGALVAVWLSITLGTVMGHGGLWRYAIQVAPLSWMLGSAGLASAVGKVWRNARRRTA